MPLSAIQSTLLQLLANNRNPESYVAGAVALDREGPRFSGDIDIFNDGDQRLVATAEADAETIRSAGSELVWTSTRGSGKRSALVTKEKGKKERGQHTYFPALSLRTHSRFGWFSAGVSGLRPAALRVTSSQRLLPVTECKGGRESV